MAGGATQNSMRAAQWLLQVPGATSYFGSVGDDDHAQKLRSAASASGLNVRPHAWLLRLWATMPTWEPHGHPDHRGAPPS